MKNEKDQHRVFVVGFTLIVLVLLGFILKPVLINWKDGKKDQEEQKANAEILKAPSIMPEDVFKKVRDKSKIYIIDISSPEDFKRGHIAMAFSASPEKMDKEYLKQMGAEKTSDIFIMNQGSDLARLATLVNKTISEGFVNVKYMRGGIADWSEKGFPLVSLGASETDSAKVKTITIDEIKRDAEKAAELLQFLDVRGNNEFAKEHVVGAINIPLSEIEKRKNEVPAVKKTIVYGANESEGFQAAVSLFDMNFFNIYQMQGGLEQWKDAGGNVANGN